MFTIPYTKQSTSRGVCSFTRTHTSITSFFPFSMHSHWYLYSLHISFLCTVFSVYFIITCSSTKNCDAVCILTPFFINQRCTTQHWTIKNSVRIHTAAIWAAEARLLDQATLASLWSPRASISLDHHDPVMVNHRYFLEVLLTETRHYRHGNPPPLHNSRFGRCYDPGITVWPLSNLKSFAHFSHS